MYLPSKPVGGGDCFAVSVEDFCIAHYGGGGGFSPLARILGDCSTNFFFDFFFMGGW